MTGKIEAPNLEIIGLAEFAETLPNDSWYEIRIRVCKIPNGAEVKVSNTARELKDVYLADGDLWYRDENDELNLLD